MVADKARELRASFDAELTSVHDAASLEAFRIKYLSRSGSLSALFEALKDVPKEEKPAAGKELNLLRNYCQQAFDQVRESVEASSGPKKEFIDLSLPGREPATGSKHIIMQTLDDIITIFRNMGFSVASGPELEDDYHNFSALNFPHDHPARDMQDTFFVNDNFLLRTHTSPVQIRVMEHQAPPIRSIMPGKVFRNEAVNSRSYYFFHQLEGLYVDEHVSFAELKGTLVNFAYQLYGSSLKYRFRPSFFPFTEPSAEMDITCFLCGGKGCRVCKHTGWLEILGGGMVDPNVFHSVGVDSERYTGYAFGMGIERIALLKYGINDIRLYFENDLRFLKQF